MITNAFGDNHILSHTHDLTSGSYNNGTLTPTNNTKAWLINSYNVTGSKYKYETSYSWQDTDKVQFHAFRYNSDLRIAKYNTNCWWLGSSTSTTSNSFCYAGSSRAVNNFGARYSGGVRPAFLVY